MGTINTAQQQRVRCYLEPNGYLGTDHSGTLGDFFDVPIIEGTVDLKLDPKNIEKKYLRQNRDQWAGNLRGVKTATLSFEIPFFLPTIRSVAGGTPAAIAETATSKMLGAWLGGQTLGTSMDASADCTVSLIKTADHANAVEGSGVAWADTNGVMYCRQVVRKDGSNDLVLDQDLPSAPVAADYVYRGIDLYLADRTTSACKTFQFLVEGAEYDEDCWLLRGGQCTSAAALTLKNGERPTWKFTFEFATYDRKDALLSAVTNVTYTNVNEVMLADGILTAWVIDTAATYTPVAIKTGIAASEISLDFANSKRMKITSPGGVGNVAAYVVVGDSPKLTGKFTCPWEENDQTWLDAHVAQSLITLCLQIGSSETSGCTLIKVGTAEITDCEIVRKNGIVEQTISFSAKLNVMHYTGVDTATELENSPFSIHIF